MEFLVYLLLIVLALLLIGIILIQPGKGDMLSGMGGIGGQFNQMLGSSRAISTLQKLTWGFAAGIIVLTLIFNYLIIGGSSQAGPSEIKPATEGVQVPVTNTPSANIPISQPATDQGTENTETPEGE